MREFSSLILNFFKGYQNICLTSAKYLRGVRKINLTIIYILKNPHYSIALSPHLGLLNYLAWYYQLWKF